MIQLAQNYLIILFQVPVYHAGSLKNNRKHELIAPLPKILPILHIFALVHPAAICYEEKLRQENGTHI